MNPDDVTLVFAPFFAAALAIERFWEMVFARYESFALSTAKIAGLSSELTKWMKTELQRATAAIAELTAKNNGGENYLEELEKAEARLQEAKARIEEALKSPGYLGVKKSIIVLGSFVLGLVISFAGELRLLHAAGLGDVPAVLDMIVTGFAIGAGSGPMHAFVNLLVELRNTFAGLADLTRGTGVSRVAETLSTRRLRSASEDDDDAREERPSLAAARVVRRLIEPR
jgi:hypothetical protein